MVLSYLEEAVPVESLNLMRNADIHVIVKVVKIQEVS